MCSREPQKGVGPVTARPEARAGVNQRSVLCSCAFTGCGGEWPCYGSTQQRTVISPSRKISFEVAVPALILAFSSSNSPCW